MKKISWSDERTNGDVWKSTGETVTLIINTLKKKKMADVSVRALVELKAWWKELVQEEGP